MALLVQKALRNAQHHMKAGSLDAAIAIYEEILAKFPKNQKAIQGYQIVVNRIKSETLATLEPPQNQIQEMLDLFQHGHLQHLLKTATKIAAQYPKSVLIFNILGMANANLAKLDVAINSFKTAINIKPDYAESHYNLGTALQKKGESAAAISSFETAIKLDPNHLGAYNNMGNSLKNIGEFERALDSFKRALQIKPDQAEVHNNMGSALQNKGDVNSAIESYQKALQIKPDYAEAHNNMGKAQQDKGEWQGALDCYRQALIIKPDFCDAHRNASSIKKYDLADPQIAQMEALYADQKIADSDRCQLCLALAKASEDVGNLNEAFKYLKEGNALRKNILHYNSETDAILFSNLKKTASAISQSLPPLKYEPSDIQPIFIVGMPRSGTSLIEQIVSSHSDVFGAGELNLIHKFGSQIALGKEQGTEINFRSFREEYLKGVARLSGKKGLIIDKMPHNFLYIDLIFRAFPESRVVHVKRDPAATCWSNFKHYFHHDGLGYSYDLDDVVKYYNLYDDLMLFWYEQYTDRIYQLDYDLLTIDQERETKKLIQYLRIDWQETCLSPHKNKRIVKTASQQQVQKEIYKGSSQKWRMFEVFLCGAFDGLERQPKVCSS